MKIDNPRFFRRDEHDLKRVQKAKDVAKNAQNWPENSRRKKVLARIYERIAWRREDFAQQISRQSVRSYEVITFENLAVPDMLKNHRLAKSIADVAWKQSPHQATQLLSSAVYGTIIAPYP